MNSRKSWSEQALHVSMVTLWASVALRNRHFYASATTRRVLDAFCLLDVHATVHPCMRDHILKVCKHNSLQIDCGNFTKFTTSMHLWTKMNWLDFEVKRSKGQSSRSYPDHIWSTKQARHFLTYLWNAWTYFNETYHGYSLPCPQDTDYIFEVMFKGQDHIVHKCTFPAETYSSTVCHRRLSSYYKWQGAAASQWLRWWMITWETVWLQLRPTQVVDIVKKSIWPTVLQCSRKVSRWKCM